MSYALGRLVRGLASPRESSRKGFFVALVELLKQAEASDLERLLSEAEKALDDTSSAQARDGRTDGRLVAKMPCSFLVTTFLFPVCNVIGFKLGKYTLLVEDS